ncbi:transcriptional regulator [Enterococcus sp. JM4C]|uniref:ArsR/SmtB family transcription factor n=1 Tax=Candidatus Enterococcus huntleyi TaxID=1857217 RepID=UPI00137B0A70|nr:metalloregulator ArsR/SmtB family transcription factor [Enterococcus sp. JM4C]KAF1295122.1 transcriptional regulator [Enterococcus sp. JM4C]
MRIDTTRDSLPIFQALANETRLSIIQLLGNHEMNIGELAARLRISNAMVTRHIKQLEECGIVKTRRSPGKSGLQKLASLGVDNIGIDFPEKIFPNYRKYETEVKIGHFTDFSVEPTCGLTSKDSFIGMGDQPRSFLDTNRVDAELVWLSKGYLEYKVPNQIQPKDHLELLEISFEISSEFPISNNTWPSDITYYINQHKIGVDTVSGNYSDVRGRLTPSWWPDTCSQYGERKHIRVDRFDSSIGGIPTSNLNIHELGLENSDFFTLRIASEEISKNVGGLTLFGEFWGNYPQHIKVYTYVS